MCIAALFHHNNAYHVVRIFKQIPKKSSKIYTKTNLLHYRSVDHRKTTPNEPKCTLALTSSRKIPIIVASLLLWMDKTEFNPPRRFAAPPAPSVIRNNDTRGLDRKRLCAVVNPLKGTELGENNRIFFFLPSRFSTALSSLVCRC